MASCKQLGIVNSEGQIKIKKLLVTSVKTATIDTVVH